MNRTARAAAVAATMVAVLAVPAAAVAAPAATAAVTCTATSGDPFRYDFNGTIYAEGWGRYDCSQSVAWISIATELYRGNTRVATNSYTANRMPGNKLINVLQYLGATPCVTGAYYVVTKASAPGQSGGAIGRTVTVVC